MSDAAETPSPSDRPRKPPFTPRVIAGLKLLVEEADAAIEFLDGAIDQPVSPKSRIHEYEERRAGLRRGRDWIVRRIAAAEFEGA